jgi:hypothetical protein
MSTSSGIALRKERSLSPASITARESPRQITGSPRSGPRTLLHRHSHHNSTSSESMERTPERVREHVESSPSQLDAIQRILASRLVETFITLASPQEEHDHSQAGSSHPSTSPRRSQQGTRKTVRPARQSPRMPSHNGVAAEHVSTPTSSRRDAPVPFFISDVHRPSTNPLFDQIDPHTDFSGWVDQSNTVLTATLWGRTGVSQVPSTSKADQEQHWVILEQWSFDTSDLIPLPSSVSDNFASCISFLMLPDYRLSYLPSS